MLQKMDPKKILLQKFNEVTMQGESITVEKRLEEMSSALDLDHARLEELDLMLQEIETEEAKA